MEISELKIKIRVTFGWKISAILAVLMLLATIRELALGRYVWAFVAGCLTAVHLMEVFIAWRLGQEEKAAP